MRKPGRPRMDIHHTALVNNRLQTLRSPLPNARVTRCRRETEVPRQPAGLILGSPTEGYSAAGLPCREGEGLAVTGPTCRVQPSPLDFLCEAGQRVAALCR